MNSFPQIGRGTEVTLDALFGQVHSFVSMSIMICAVNLMGTYDKKNDSSCVSDNTLAFSVNEFHSASQFSGVVTVRHALYIGRGEPGRKSV